VYRNERQEEKLNYKIEYGRELERENGSNVDEKSDSEATKSGAAKNSKRDVSQLLKIRLVDVTRRKENINNSSISKI
jgi:hypothetical protein